MKVVFYVMYVTLWSVICISFAVKLPRFMQISKRCCLAELLISTRHCNLCFYEFPLPAPLYCFSISCGDSECLSNCAVSIVDIVQNAVVRSMLDGSTQMIMPMTNWILEIGPLLQLFFFEYFLKYSDTLYFWNGIRCHDVLATWWPKELIAMACRNIFVSWDILMTSWPQH